jgi:F-type H+-transporting ATPase subunit epsilon
MAIPFTVSIVTPEKIAYERPAFSVILPGLEGYLGVWANHAPLVTGLKAGVVTIREDEAGTRMTYMSVSVGFVEISENQVSILCDSCEVAADIDVDRARQALERAKGRLRAHERDLDAERARKAIERAQARIHAAYLLEGHR